MKYKLTTYTNDTQVRIQELDRQPSLSKLQEEVGGFIEQVPAPFYLDSNKDWFSQQHDIEKLEAVYCNEDGKFISQFANRYFIPAPSGDSLYGNILVVERIEE